jgi:hypothetical protein
MSKIFIGQYQGLSFISKLIRWRTWSKVTHTAAFLPYPHDENLPGDMVIEADTKQGVIHRPWNIGHTKGTIIDIYSIYCTKEQKEYFYNFLYGKLKAKYDLFAILGFITRKHLENDNRWFCSELIFEALGQELQKKVLQNIESYQVSPREFNISPALKFIERRVTLKNGEIKIRK